MRHQLTIHEKLLSFQPGLLRPLHIAHPEVGSSECHRCGAWLKERFPTVITEAIAPHLYTVTHTYSISIRKILELVVVSYIQLTFMNISNRIRSDIVMSISISISMSISDSIFIGLSICISIINSNGIVN